MAHTTSGKLKSIQLARTLHIFRLFPKWIPKDMDLDRVKRMLLFPFALNFSILYMTTNLPIVTDSNGLAMKICLMRNMIIVHRRTMRSITHAANKPASKSPP